MTYSGSDKTKQKRFKTWLDFFMTKNAQNQKYYEPTNAINIS